MAKYEAAVLRVHGVGEVRFGKTDKVVALPLTSGAYDGWIYVSRDGEVYHAPAEDFGVEIKAALVVHGQKQKEKDSAASLETPAEMMVAIRRVHEQLAAGTFNAAGGGFGIDGILVESVMAYGGIDRPAAEEYLKSLSPAERSALKVDDEIKPHYDQIAAARASKVDTKSLLAKIKVAA